MPGLYLNSGQIHCYDTSGSRIPCLGSGQDAEEAPGLPWPDPRFRSHKQSAEDCLTGLHWTRKANFAEYPLTWDEAFGVIGRMNEEGFDGHHDWRLPNRRELRSLVSYQTRDPALPEGSPFQDVFLGWYWTSTTAAINTAYAWYVHMEGGRMFYGRKTEFRLMWPVRGMGSGALPATGQVLSFDSVGNPVPGGGSGGDGDLRMGVPWPEPRFRSGGETVLDRLTGLVWTRSADLAERWTTWAGALEVVDGLNRSRLGDRSSWRLPTINELESLVDASRHTPALSPTHPFLGVQEAYWSSTTSAFEPDWCMALYMYKGAVGVGQKKDENFSVWAVSREGDARKGRA